MRPWLLFAHAATAGIFTFILLLCPQYLVYQKIIPPARALFSAAVVALAIVVIILVTVGRFGVQRLRTATLVPVVLMLFFLLKLNGPLLDKSYSARPLQGQIQSMAPDTSAFAVYHVRRDLVYGLAFYRNEAPIYYEDGIPAQAHILVIRSSDTHQLRQLLAGRTYQPLFIYEWDGLSVYKVDARP